MTDPDSVTAADLVVVPDEKRELVNVLTGERLPVTLENAAAVIDAAREMKRRMDVVIRDATEVVAEESRRQGTKSFAVGSVWKVELSGGDIVTYDPVRLREALQAADCPEERIDAVIKTKVEFNVDRRVLKQLTAANPDYAAAAALAEERETKPFSASVKGA